MRIVATVGTVVELAAGLVAAAVLARHYANCGGASCTGEFVAAAAALVYAIAQAGLIVLIWRARQAPTYPQTRIGIRAATTSKTLSSVRRDMPGA